MVSRGRRCLRGGLVSLSLALLLALLCSYCFTPSDAAGIDATCMANFNFEVGNIVFNDTYHLTAQQKQDLELYLSTTFMPCAMKKDIIVDKAISVIVPNTPFIPLMRNLTSSWEKTTAVSVRFDVVGENDIVQEARNDIQQNTPVLAHAGYLLPSSQLGSVAGLGGAANLATFMTSSGGDSLLQWHNMLGFLRTQVAVYDGRVSCIPLDGDILLLYYRSDILEEKNIPVPDTWEELVQVATQLNGTDMNGDGQGDYGACMPKHSCFMSYWPFLFAAPYLQYNGTSQGGFFDPETTEPLTDNAAFVEAMKLFKSIMQFGSPQPETECLGASKLFNEGRCLFTVLWGDQFKASQQASHSIVRGKVGVSITPGSTRVWDRSNQTLSPCTASLCPYAEPVLKNGVPTLVNRTPYSANGGWCFVVDQIATQDSQDDAFNLAAYLASPQVSMQIVLNPNSTMDPFRVEHLDVSKWVDAGYNFEDSSVYLNAVQKSLNNPNVLLQLRVPMNSRIMPLIASEATRFLLDKHVTPEEMSHRLSQALASVMSSDPSSKEFYQKGIGWKPIVQGTPPKRKSHPHWQNKMLGIAIVVSVGLLVCSMVAVVFFGLCIMKRHAKHRTLFGNIRPPPASPESTLVITDIQGSTSLWELLPSDVMDRALALHHQGVRKLLVQHGGYESATEGDSFILAFHAPQDALLFTADLQQQLLTMDWPQQLLQCPLCKPVYGSPRCATATALISTPRDPDPHILLAGNYKVGLGSRKNLLKSSPPPEMLLATSRPLLEPSPPTDGKSTFANVLKKAWHVVESEDDIGRMNGGLLFRGLRVRIGIHSGIDSSCLVSNMGANRIQYAGEALAITRKVSDAAPGGLVVMSGATYRQLAVEPLTQSLLLMHCGTHCLDCPADPHSVYLVLPRCLVGRLALLSPLRTLKQLSNGALEAPTGSVTIAFVYVVGAQALAQWDPVVAGQSFGMLQDLATQLLQEHDGYCAEVADNLLLATFHSPSAALTWGLQLHKQALLLEWPEKLLQNELAEVMTVGNASGGDSSTQEPLHKGNCVRNPQEATEAVSDGAPWCVQLVLRGLRLKIGLDMGEALSAPHSVTGRMAYRGRVMNRAARIASMASAGEVLCSSGVWAGLDASALDEMEGVALGEVSLKGVSQPQRIMQCRLRYGRACMQSTQRISLMNEPSMSSELAWVAEHEAGHDHDHDHGTDHDQDHQRLDRDQDHQRHDRNQDHHQRHDRNQDHHQRHDRSQDHHQRHDRNQDHHQRHDRTQDHHQPDRNQNHHQPDHNQDDHQPDRNQNHHQPDHNQDHQQHDDNDSLKHPVDVRDPQTILDQNTPA